MHVLAAASSKNPLVPNWTEVIVGGIAFFIVFFALWKVLMPRIMKALEERTDAIEGGLKKAEDAQADAARRVAEQSRRKWPMSRHEAARLREQAREEGAAINARAPQGGQEEKARIVESGHVQIEADRQQALASLRAEVGTLAVQLASKIVGESLEDVARQSRVVDRFLADLDATRRTRGADIVMRGISRASLAEVEQRLEPPTADAQAAAELGDELFAVAGLLASQPALRRALADPSRSSRGQGRARKLGAIRQGQRRGSRNRGRRGGCPLVNPE